MRVAVVGCGHGELDRIYETIEYMRTARYGWSSFL